LKWSKKKTKKLQAAMDANKDGLVVLEEFLFYYRSVIYDIPDDQFECGLEEFREAVGRVCAQQGVAPPEF
jgi:hypothetical protein